MEAANSLKFASSCFLRRPENFDQKDPRLGNGGGASAAAPPVVLALSAPAEKPASEVALALCAPLFFLGGRLGGTRLGDEVAERRRALSLCCPMGGEVLAFAEERLAGGM